MNGSFLSVLRASDIELWVERGELRYRAPAGAMTDALMGQLREHKAALLGELTTDIELMAADAIEHFEERSAIGEFDGGLSRAEAERQAASRVFEYQLRGWPSHQWGVLLMLPGETLADAEHWCIERFGPEKFVEARPYRPGGGT